MKAIKNYLIHYFSLYFVLSYLIYFIYTIETWAFFSVLLLILYNIIIYKKEKLTVDIIKVNITLFILSLLSFTISYYFNPAMTKTSIWVIFEIIIAPFFALQSLAFCMGSKDTASMLILVILFINICIQSLLLKQHYSLKKIILFLITISLCIGLNQYSYQNAPFRKYKGHDFEYMNGYSSTDLSDYSLTNPDNKLIKLKEKSTFMIENEKDMPRLDGAEACYPVYSAIANAVYKDIAQIEKDSYDDHQWQNGNIVSFTNTSDGYYRLMNKEIDMFFGAKPSAALLEEAKSTYHVEFEYTPIGREAFVFFVNEKNPIKNLSVNQIKSIYHGTITNWKQVGGKDADIIAFQRPENSGSQSMMNAFMGDTTLKEPLTYEMQSGMGGIIEEVAQYHNEDGAIGYTFKYFLEGLHQEDHVKLLSINDVYPTSETIKNETYPISTYLYCVTLKSNQKENVKKLKEYLLSEQGQYIIEETGYCALR